MIASTTTSLQQQPPPPVLTNSFVIQQQPMQQQRPPPAPTSYSTSKPGPTQFVEQWRCDICRSKKFDTFQEAEAHEIECQLAQEAKKIADQQQLQHDLTGLALCQPTVNVASQAIPGERRCAINLVPQGDAANVLSDHNNLLVRHVEFFYPSSGNRVGLRCIHCKYAAKQTASTFFPSSINSISSGFGTIGTRHFGWGKCPIVHASIVAELKVTKKTSNVQTKTNGRVGLDAYCKNLAKQYGIFDDAGKGISWVEGTVPNNFTQATAPRRCDSTGVNQGVNATTASNALLLSDSKAVAAVLASMRSTENVFRPIPSTTSLVHVSDKASTSDLAFFTLSQVEPYKTLGQSKDEDDDSREVGFPGVVCKHCMKNSNGGRKFFTTSSEHLGDLLLTISNHMTICVECPDTVKDQISTYQAGHEMQIGGLPAGEHDACMKRVWTRLIEKNKHVPSSSLSSSSSNASTAKPAAKRTVAPPRLVGPPIQYRDVDPSMSLVSPSDEQIVTPFTYFTMSQLRPCNLGRGGGSNGSRSTFDVGFPGLECLHCGGGPNSRRFFYRSAEVLGGNWSHIPNHTMSCASCPFEIKQTLKQLKVEHQTLKLTLPKGNNKEFFNSVWERLHDNMALPSEAAPANADDVPPPMPDLPELPALPALSSGGSLPGQSLNGNTIYGV